MKILDHKLAMALVFALLCGCGAPLALDDAGVANEEKLLDMELAENPPAFLAHCKQILDANGPLAAAALVKRAAFYSKSGKPKPAALDLARLWAEHPDAVEEAGLAATIPASLQQAGFYLEAGLLTSASDANETAAAVWARLQHSSGSSSPTARYMAHTPDLDALLQSSGNAPGEEAADFIARAACVACRQNNFEANRLLEAFTEKTAAGLTAQNISLPDLKWLDACAAVVVEEAKKTREVRIFSEEDVLPEGLSAAIHALEDLRTNLLETIAARARAQSPDAFARATEQLVAFCLSIDNRLAVRNACERAIESFAGSRREAVYRLKLADMYREIWKTPTLAMREYRALRSRFPNSPIARKAQLRECMALRDLERYGEAFSLAAGLFEGAEPAPAARLFAAACAVDMDSPEKAHECVWDLVRISPEAPEASQGLLWLANTKVKSQDYPGALEALRYLADNYPNSAEAAKARVTMGRLEKSTTVAQRTR